MKVGVEGAIKELGFENAIILRPGMTIERERSKAPILEKLVESLKSVERSIRDKLGKN